MHSGFDLVARSGGPLQTTILLLWPVFVWLLVSVMASAGILLLGFLRGRRGRRVGTRRRRHLRPVGTPARAAVRLEVWGLPLRVLHVCSAVPEEQATDAVVRPAGR